MATAATIDVLLRANTATYRAAMVDAARVTNQQLGRIQAEVKQTAAVMSQMRAAAAGIISVQVLRSSVGALLDVTKQNQALVNSMKASTGSAKLSADALSFVSQAAKELGLDYQSAAQGFQRMTASATANGIAMKDQQQLFLEVSRAATSMQIAPAQVDRAMTALSQSFSKGRFQAEELRQQLAEAIPGVVPRFQKAVMELTKGTDLAGKSFYQLLQGGLLDVKTFLPAMTQAFAQMGASWQDGSQSIQAETNRLGNAWRKFKLDLADGVFGDTAVAGIKAATVALEGMGAVMPVLVPAVTALAAVKLGQSTAEWVRGLNAGHAAMLAQKVAAEQSASALVAKTRIEMLDAQASAARARAAYGGSIAADLAAVTATNAHTRALATHAAAQEASAIASNRLAMAGRAALGFFGGPAGLAFMVASTAASWLIFRDNTKEAQQALIDWNNAADDAVTKFYELNKAQQSGEILKLQQQIQANAEKLSETIANMALGAGPSENIVSENDLRLATAYAESMRSLQAQWEAGKITADELSNAVDAQNKKLISGSTDARYFAEAITEQGAALGTTSREIQKQQSYLDTITGKQYSAGAAARDHAQGLNALNNAANSMDWGNLDEWLKKQREAASARYSQAALGEVGSLREQFEQQLLKDQAFTNGTREQVAARRAEWGAIQRTMEETKKLEEAKKAETKATRALSSATADAGQNAIRAAQARQQEYKLELAAGESLSTSKRDLLKFELELRDTKDKHLKASAGTIRAILEENVAIEEQIAVARRLNEAKLQSLATDRQIADYRDSVQQRHARDLDAIQHGGNTARWNDIAGGVNDEFRQQRLRVDRAHQDTLLSIPQEDMKRRNEEQQRYLELIGKTVIAESDAMMQARRNFEETLEAQSSMINGLRSGLEDYIAAAQDLAGQTRDIVGNIFGGAEDLAVEFFTKGKADWKAYVDEINAQFLRMMIRQQLSKLAEKFLPGISGTGSGEDQAAAMAGAAGKLAASAAPLYGAAAALTAAAAALAAAGLASAAGGSGGGTNWAALVSMGIGAFGYDAGGYTGPGGRKQPAGVVHKGEVVWSQMDVARGGGVAAVEAMRRGLRGYDVGGTPGGASLVRLGHVGRRPEDSEMLIPGGNSRPKFQQQVTFHVVGKIDNRTQSQIASEMRREGNRAAMRFG